MRKTTDQVLNQHRAVRSPQSFILGARDVKRAGTAWQIGIRSLSSILRQH